MTGGPTAPEAVRPRTRLGVLGWPVAHSRSPAIQHAALHRAGLHEWRYQPLPAPPELFAELVAALPAAGFRGVNVTIPHKGAALALATRPTDRARAIGAANTLVFDDGAIVADNTDAPALIAALPLDVAGASAMVLGAGGTARAAAWALRHAGARTVSICNRSADRAWELAAALGDGVTVTPRAVDADVLINCTSVGLRGEDPFVALGLTPEGLSGYHCVVDYAYGAHESALCAAARAAGLAAVDGLQLLVGQGALSFARFTGREADVGAMRAAVRQLS